MKNHAKPTITKPTNEINIESNLVLREFVRRLIDVSDVNIITDWNKNNVFVFRLGRPAFCIHDGVTQFEIYEYESDSTTCGQLLDVTEEGYLILYKKVDVRKYKKVLDTSILNLYW